MSADDFGLPFRTMQYLDSNASKTEKFIIYIMATYSTKKTCSALHIFSTAHIEAIITVDHS